MGAEAIQGRRLETINQESVDVCAKLPELPKTVDTRFDICQDTALVLKIGRDFQNKDGYRGAHYDTVKLLCDAIEYQREQAAKLREALEALLNLAYEVEDMNSDSGPRTSMPTKFVIDTAKAGLADTSSQKEDNK